MDRIEFEELALKGLDPSLGPSLAQSSKVLEKGPRVCRLARLKPTRLFKALTQIPLIYPSSLSSDSESLLHLQTLLEHRMPQHRKGFYLWMIIAPLTAPFMIVRASHFSILPFLDVLRPHHHKPLYPIFPFSSVSGDRGPTTKVSSACWCGAMVWLTLVVYFQHTERHSIYRTSS
jgi:hypothetical protein